MCSLSDHESIRGNKSESLITLSDVYLSQCTTLRKSEYDLEADLLQFILFSYFLFPAFYTIFYLRLLSPAALAIQAFLDHDMLAYFYFNEHIYFPPPVDHT